MALTYLTTIWQLTDMSSRLRSSVHWVAVALAGVCLAMSMVWIFVAFLNYLVDTYLMYAASAIAANTVVRSAAGAAAPLFTNQMFTRLGVGGGGSLIGGVATVLAIIPFAFYRYGERIRVRSKFAPTDKKKKPADDEERQEQQHRQGQQHQQHQQDGRSGPATAEHEEEETAARHSSSSTITGDATEPDEQPPRAYDSAHRHLASEDGREKDRDVHQNEMGEPRTENAMFGKEGR
jgi:DHA1 family multidrug resistance protein-like MFS transporter